MVLAVQVTGWKSSISNYPDLVWLPSNYKITEAHTALLSACLLKHAANAGKLSVQYVGLV